MNETNTKSGTILTHMLVSDTTDWFLWECRPMQMQRPFECQSYTPWLTEHASPWHADPGCSPQLKWLHRFHRAVWATAVTIGCLPGVSSQLLTNSHTRLPTAKCHTLRCRGCQRPHSEYCRFLKPNVKSHHKSCIFSWTVYRTALLARLLSSFVGLKARSFQLFWLPAVVPLVASTTTVLMYPMLQHWG